jgi:hypothetical protein
MRPTWEKTEFYMSFVADGDVALVLFVGLVRAGEWLASALEVTKPESQESVAMANELFDNHAHEVIGKYKTMRAAKRAASKRGRAWLAARAKIRTPLKACACGPVH